MSGNVLPANSHGETTGASQGSNRHDSHVIEPLKPSKPGNFSNTSSAPALAMQETRGTVSDSRRRGSTLQSGSDNSYADADGRSMSSQYPLRATNNQRGATRDSNGTPVRSNRYHDEEMGYGSHDTPTPGQANNTRLYSLRGGHKGSKLPIIRGMSDNARTHLVASIGEFVGTFIFLFLSFAGTEVAQVGMASSTASGETLPFDPSIYLYIAIAFGFSLMISIWVFAGISGAHFNPAVTLGLVAVGGVSIVRAVCYFFAQILGAIAASAVVLGLFPTTFGVRTTLTDGTSKVQGVFIEAFATGQLVFTILFLAKDAQQPPFIAPVGIGLSLFLGELISVYWTGGALNPARAFGPSVVSGTFETDHWIYWVGPFVGTLIALIFYELFKVLEYETINPSRVGKSIETSDEASEIAEKQHERTQLGSPSLSQVISGERTEPGSPLHPRHLEGGFPLGNSNNR